MDAITIEFIHDSSLGNFRMSMRKRKPMFVRMTMVYNVAAAFKINVSTPVQTNLKKRISSHLYAKQKLT